VTIANWRKARALYPLREQQMRQAVADNIRQDETPHITWRFGVGRVGPWPKASSTCNG
jgi:hypothetical protein